MAKKDTYLALLRRGIDDSTAQLLADAGLKIGDLKKIDAEKLVENYGLKQDIAEGVISIIAEGPQSHGKERFLAKVLAPDRKQESRIEEMRFKRKQKDVLSELAEQKERIKLAKVTAFKDKKLIMNRLGKTVELIVKLENSLDDEGKDDQKVKIRDQLETRGLEAARDHEMLELEGTPQDIVDFRRKHVPALIFHACPNVGMRWILVNLETWIEAKTSLSSAGNVKPVSRHHSVIWSTLASKTVLESQLILTSLHEILFPRSQRTWALPM